MRRFVLGWKTMGHQERLKAFIVNYADDLVICCRGSAQEALAAMREMMCRLKLTVNETKTRVCCVPKESSDFLGYTFGRLWSPRTGRPYLGICPSKKRIKRFCEKVTQATERRITFRETEAVVGGLNRMISGWANYFCLGSVSQAYNDVDRHVGLRLRRWLLPSTRSVDAFASGISTWRPPPNWAWSVCKGAKAASRGQKHEVLLRKPDAANPHVRFDEREVETERFPSPRHLSTLPIAFTNAMSRCHSVTRRPASRGMLGNVAGPVTPAMASSSAQHRL
jgi:hypothetical protein